MNQERISTIYAMFFRALIIFLKNPNRKNKAELLPIARKTGEVDRDEMPFVPRRDLSKGFSEMLKKLKAKDPKEWVQILGRARATIEGDGFKKYLNELKEMSPFSGEMILWLTNGTVSGEMVEFLENLIQSQGLKKNEWCFISISGLDIKREDVKVISLE